MKTVAVGLIGTATSFALDQGADVARTFGRLTIAEWSGIAATAAGFATFGWIVLQATLRIRTEIRASRQQKNREGERAP